MRNIALAGAAIVAAIGSSALPARAASPALTFSMTAPRPLVFPAGPWKAGYATHPPVRRLEPGSRAMPEMAAGAKKGTPKPPKPVPLATFTRKISARGANYSYTLVGSDPFVKRAKPVTVTTYIVPLRIEFDDGTVADPTEASSCAGGHVAIDDILQSPLFADNDYGDGHPRQYVENFRYDEFWSQTGAPNALNPSYSVRLAPAVLPTITIQAHGSPTKIELCGRLGMLDIDTLDNLLFEQIIPSLKPLGVAANTLPMFVLHGVIMTESDDPNGVIGGYHNAGFATAPTAPGPDKKAPPPPPLIQTWAVANYDDTHDFHFDQDVAVGSHELAEWLDDPYTINPTPAWGHTGQVGGCQNNLEVGDPLSGTFFEMDVNGMTYHPQELAFFSWFFDQSPSIGINGWYSSNGSFTAPADLCQ